MSAARIPSRPGRRLTITVSALLVTALALLPGCSFWAENVVAENYAPADGLSADLTDLKIRNLLVVGSDTGAAVVSASLFNQTSEALTVRLTIGDGVLDTTVDVPADGRLTLTGAAGSGAASAPAAGEGSSAAPSAEASPAAEAGSAAATEVILLEDLPVPPGGAVTIGITSPGGGTVTRTAPVVLDQGAYEGFVPAQAPVSS